MRAKYVAGTKRYLVMWMEIGVVAELPKIQSLSDIQIFKQLANNCL